MKREQFTKSKYAVAQTLLAMVAAGPALTASTSAAVEVERPAFHELAAIANTLGPRLWYHEAEFARDPLLRATPRQVVVLHLEPADGGGRSVSNTIPYRFAETAPYTFCVPKKDPYIRSLSLIREDSHAVVVRVPRNAPCKTRTIAAGLYRLQVNHDGTAIGADGKKAFVHVPRFKETAQLGASAPSSFPSCDNGPFFDNDARLLFTAPNGGYVVGNGKIGTSPTPPGDGSGNWVICHDASGNYMVSQSSIFGPPNVFFSSGPPNMDTSLYSVEEDSISEPTAFKLTDLGNGQFTLAANFGGTLYPIVLGADGGLHWTTSGPLTIFTIALKYYEAGATAQPLLPGEAALFQACNYGVSSTGTWVFDTNISDFRPFSVASTGISLDNTVASVKLGPQIIATLYADPNFSGTAQVISQDTPCLNGTPLGVNTASSRAMVESGVWKS